MLDYRLIVGIVVYALATAGSSTVISTRSSVTLGLLIGSGGILITLLFNVFGAWRLSRKEYYESVVRRASYEARLDAAIEQLQRCHEESKAVVERLSATVGQLSRRLDDLER